MKVFLVRWNDLRIHCNHEFVSSLSIISNKFKARSNSLPNGCYLVQTVKCNLFSIMIFKLKPVVNMYMCTNSTTW